MVDKRIFNYSTPLYFFDIEILKKRVGYLKSHLPNIDLCYAIKANTFIVKDIEGSVERLEVCSPGEYYICKEQGINPDKLVISGVYKTPEVIEEMFNDGVRCYTIESMTQYKLINELVNKYNVEIKLLLRVTSGNQFGINEEELKYIISNNSNPLININGLQYFSGTQKTHIKTINKELNKLDILIKELKEELNYEVEELEFGGGFPVYYFESDKVFNEEEYLREFMGIISSMEYSNKIILELGRSIAASCGSYITRVVDTKSNKNGNYAVMDGGMHHLAYYGQMMAMKRPFYDIYPSRCNNDIKEWNLVGSLCTINDLIVKKLSVDSLSIGDYFIFKNTGAYCMCEGISLFLSRALPIVLLKRDNELVKVRSAYNTYHLNTFERW